MTQRKFVWSPQGDPATVNVGVILDEFGLPNRNLDALVEALFLAGETGLTRTQICRGVCARLRKTEIDDLIRAGELDGKLFRKWRAGKKYIGKWGTEQSGRSVETVYHWRFSHAAKNGQHWDRVKDDAEIPLSGELERVVNEHDAELEIQKSTALLVQALSASQVHPPFGLTAGGAESTSAQARVDRQSGGRGGQDAASAAPDGQSGAPAAHPAPDTGYGQPAPGGPPQALAPETAGASGFPCPFCGAPTNIQLCSECRNYIPTAQFLALANG